MGYMPNASTPGWGAECHFHQEKRPVPACVITDAAGQKLIVNSDPNPDGKRGWVVRSATVNVTRVWSASTATIYLTAKAPEIDVRAPDIPEELSIERQIAIYLGYLSELRPATLEDIQANRLIRCFIGVVDTLTAACTGRVGYSVKVQCRDRIRWFMESALTFNLTTEDLARVGQLPSSGQQSAPGGITRPAVIWFIMNAALGRNEVSKLVCSDREQGGSLCRPCQGCGVSLQAELLEVSQGRRIYGDAAFIKGRTENQPATNPINVGTIILTSRLEFGSDITSFLLADNSALLTLKSLSYQEAFPTELFQDPHTGRIYYAPVGNDLTGLEDPKRFHRTYYIRNVPRSMTVHSPNQMLLNYKEELSSLGVRTNIVVGAPRSNGSGEHVVHLHAMPYEFSKVPVACRYAVVEDPTLTSATEALMVALAYSRETSRALKSAHATVIGDPSFALGEAIQVISTPLKLRGQELHYQMERSEIKSMEEQAVAYLQNVATTIENAKTKPFEAQVMSSPYPKDNQLRATGMQASQTDLACTPEYEINRGFYNKPLETIWRVQAVIHHFKSSGYVTELLLVSPY